MRVLLLPLPLLLFLHLPHKRSLHLIPIIPRIEHLVSVLHFRSLHLPFLPGSKVDLFIPDSRNDPGLFPLEGHDEFGIFIEFFGLEDGSPVDLLVAIELDVVESVDGLFEVIGLVELEEFGFDGLDEAFHIVFGDFEEL